MNVGAATLVVVSEPSPAHTVMGLPLSHAASYAVGCAPLGTLLARRDILQPGVLDHQLTRVVTASAGLALALGAGAELPGRRPDGPS